MHRPTVTLHEAISAVAPIECVSVERWEDRGSWRVTLMPEATAEQRAAAEAVMRAFDPNEMQPVQAADVRGSAANITVSPVVRDDALTARVAQLEAMLEALAAEARKAP